MTMHPNKYFIATGQLHGKDPEHAVIQLSRREDMKNELYSSSKTSVYSGYRYEKRRTITYINIPLNLIFPEVIKNKYVLSLEEKNRLLEYQLS